MKIYLCTKCNKTIPLQDLAEHRKQCGPDSDITLKEGLGRKVGRGFKLFFMLLLAVALVGGGILLGHLSFRKMAAMRRLERIPPTVVQAALPGEINLNGRAQPHRETLKAPRTKTTCLYYRYLVERKERDSDGDTRWVTETDRTEFKDFFLVDATGRILLHPDRGVDFNARKAFSTTVGNRRYSEWRIDPNDTIFVFGYAVDGSTGYEVVFNREGQYDPIISEFGETRERLGMAGWSIGLCWAGLVALAFSLALLVALLRMHRLLVYFTILGLAVAIYLVALALSMMRDDLSSAVARLEHHEETARELTQHTLQASGIRWNGNWAELGSFQSDYRQLAPETAERLSRIRLNLAQSIQRVHMQRHAFPERVLAPLWGIPAREPLPLPDAQRALLEHRAAEFEKAKVPPLFGWITIGICLAAAVVAFIFGFRKVRFKRCIENLPTSPTAGAVYGLCEFKGVVELAEADEPLEGPLSLQPCVEYHYKVEERRGSGKNAKWVTIVNENERCPFYCRDADGRLLVDPEGARVITAHRTSRREGRRRYSETRLEIDDPVYAIGECVIEPTRGDTLYLKDPEGDDPFILSNLTESTVMRKLAFLGIVLLNISFAAIVLLALTLFGLSGSFAATDYLAAALAAPLFMTAVTLVLHYNDLVFLRQRADRNWSNIDVSLKKRHDLIPQLVNTVKAYMEHEAGLQERVAALRSAYAATESRDPESIGRFLETEHAATTRLLALYENYPELQADRQSAYLMRSLVMMENEIGFMRAGYNDAVETYNTRIQVLPDLFFARLFHFKPKTFVHAETEKVAVPPRIQSLWEREEVSAGTAAPEPAVDETPAADEKPRSPTASERTAALVTAAGGAPGAEDRVPEDMSPAATDARAVIYALLLNDEPDTREAQLQAIASQDAPEVRDKAVGLIDAIHEQITNDVARLQEAEKWFDGIRGMSPGGYRAFKKNVRALMEQDAVISLFEYALQKSMTRSLDAAFGMRRTRPIRHRNLELITQQTSILLSRLAWAEETPQETAQAAFGAGVSQLNHEPKSDLELVPVEQCSIPAFDAALEETAHATNMVKANILRACSESVLMNQDYTYDQALLLIAVADAYDRDRPDWIFQQGE